MRLLKGQPDPKLPKPGRFQKALEQIVDFDAPVGVPLVQQIDAIQDIAARALAETPAETVDAVEAGRYI
jgi:hypothetical protein